MTTGLRSTVAHLPHSPGVYLFSDARSEIIYVGKARDLKRRVASYFQRTTDLSPAKREMVRETASLATIVTPSETDALILEATQIKQHQPRYNVILKDDKDFLSVRINLDEPYPALEFIRRARPRKGARLFGPYTSAYTIRQSLRLLKKLLPYRTCGQGPHDPCFDSRLGRCLGHDLEPRSRERYAEIIRGVVSFLEGRTTEVIAEATRRMRDAARHRQFELAAKLRDQVASLERLTSGQIVIGKPREHFDVIGLARAGSWTSASVLLVRAGRIIEHRTFPLTARADEASSEVMRALLEQYYRQVQDAPKRVVVDVLPAEPPTLPAGMRVAFPRRGRLRKLTAMASENARLVLERKRKEAATDAERGRRAMEDLLGRLQLSTLPKRIETFDISNIQGAHSVGSMVVFTNGLPDKPHYRKFTIKTVAGSDDCASLREVLTRRLKNQDWPSPDLLVIDGGRGQLSAALDAQDAVDRHVPTVALAKREEEVFRPGQKTSLKLRPDSEALLLLERMRDEAHRFAIGFYRGKHGQALVRSALDAVPGIGPKTKKLLLTTFGSVEGIRRASDAALQKVVGVKRLQLLREHL